MKFTSNPWYKLDRCTVVLHKETDTATQLSSIKEFISDLEERKIVMRTVYRKISALKNSLPVKKEELKRCSDNYLYFQRVQMIKDDDENKHRLRFFPLLDKLRNSSVKLFDMVKKVPNLMLKYNMKLGACHEFLTILCHNTADFEIMAAIFKATIGKDRTFNMQCLFAEAIAFQANLTSQYEYKLQLKEASLELKSKIDRLKEEITQMKAEEQDLSLQFEHYKATSKFTQDADL